MFAEFRLIHEIPVPGYYCRKQQGDGVYKWLSASPAVLFVGHFLRKIHITKVIYDFGYMPGRLPFENSKTT
jgi:hypothetical protein